MTREDIERMEAGREMDALIAEKVMGWERRRMSGVAGHWWAYVTSDGKEGRSVDVWMPSEDIGAAWKVVEKIARDGYIISFGYSAKMINGSHVTIDSYAKGNQHDLDFWVEAVTMPLAICRAALLAVMEAS